MKKQFPSNESKRTKSLLTDILALSADPRLLGALRKTVLPAEGGGGVCVDERMDETHLSAFHSISNHAHGKRLTNSISSVAQFFFWSHARDCTMFTSHDLTDFLRREGDSIAH